jgi:hypothetical protein
MMIIIIFFGNTRKDKYRGGKRLLSTYVEDLSLMVFKKNQTLICSAYGINI